MKFITRTDDGLGEGLYDSIAWAFEVHVKAADRQEIQAGVLYGNEDSPERIEFFAEAEPLVTSVPVLVWEPSV